MEAVIESVSSAMRQTINESLEQIGSSPIDVIIGSQQFASSQKKLIDESKKKMLKAGLTAEMDDAKEKTVISILNDSETYLEKNMNAASNNLSILTLHTFEISKYLE